MPHPTATRTPLATSRTLRWSVRLLIAAAALPAWRVSANCPEPYPPLDAEASAFASIDPSAPIQVESDSVEATRDGQMLLKGEVTISQQARTIKTHDATYDRDSNRFSVEGGVDYADPALRIRGTGAQLDPAGSVTFRGAEFELPAIPARGSADRIAATAEGEVSLDKVRYTTCPIGNEDWLLSASSIDISQQRGIGTGRNVRLDFKGVPILYVPYFSFPVGNERKSGFLYPSFGGYSRDGLSVPWYWNIRPNLDATLVPTFDYKRGAKLDTEWRYLLRNGSGMLETQWLPHDQDRDTDRSYVRFVSQTDFTRALRLDLDAAEVSDSQWFEDFGQGPEGTSVTYLSRAAQLSYRTNRWDVFARVQNFQTIDELIPEASRPFTVLPQIGIRGLIPNLAYGLTFGFDGEIANFTHTLDDAGVLATGARFDIAPQIRMPLRGAGVYLEPAVAWRYTTYLLEDTPAGGDSSPSRSAPIFSLDGSLSFERLTGSRGQRLQTLEPRLMYLYVPYRYQDHIPVFDTTVADLNLVQLFRTNRYSGWDRLSDANQLSVGITSRLLDAENGKQFISATVGQAFYFHRPRVTLPGEPLDDMDNSDIIAELQLTAYQNWNIKMGVQWDPDDSRAERGDVQLQYRPSHDRVVNVGYRFRRGIGTDADPTNPNAAGPFSVTRRSLEQIDGSVAWPIGERWSAYARMVYSLEDEQPLDQFAGIEYRSCCWRLRLVGRRYVRSREGDMDTSILLQLELNGLSSVGTGADTFLERSIQGYSPRAPELR
jgi:LPS-assembly protein